MVGPIAMLYNIGQVMISKREDKIKPWHSLKHKLVGDSRLSLVFYLGNCVKHNSKSKEILLN